MDFKNAKKTITILIVISFALVGVLSFSILRTSITGGTIEDDYYTYTKAICDENNYCQDYEIVCRNGNVEKINPITGAAVQNPTNWEDPRVESGLCD